MQRSCHQTSGDLADKINKCSPAPHGKGGTVCYCDEDYCNGKQMDALASRDSDSPDSSDSESSETIQDASDDSDSPETMDASPDSDSPESRNSDIGPRCDSLTSVDPEMIFLLIGVVITFIL